MAVEVQSGSEQLRKWFSDAITYFRKESETLSVDERTFIANNSDYFAPCQIEVIWLKEPEIQIIIKTNFPERSDSEIIINGPYSYQEFYEKVDSVLTASRWTVKVPKSNTSIQGIEEPLYSEILASALRQMTDVVRASLFSPRRSVGQVSGYRPANEMWVELRYENVGTTDYVATFNQILEQAKQQAQTVPLTSQSSETKDAKLVKGYVTYFYPPILVGHRKKPSAAEILRGNNFLPFYGAAVDLTINSIPVVVNEGGLIFVGVPKKERALKILNIIMAIATLRGLNLTAVREHEIGEGDFNEEKRNLGNYGYPLSTLRTMIGGPENLNRGLILQRSEVEKEILVGIISEAGSIMNNEKLSDELVLFGEGTTHFGNAEYVQSFIMSWSILERHISELWKVRVDQKDLDEEREQKLKSSAIWGLDYQLESLNLVGVVSDEDYEIYSDLKRKRNKLIHSGRTVSKEDAEKSLGLAKGIIASKIDSRLQFAKK